MLADGFPLYHKMIPSQLRIAQVFFSIENKEWKGMETGRGVILETRIVLLTLVSRRVAQTTGNTETTENS